ncbi:DUF4129 domain-containing protein [Mycolicibacterium wolinskyi]|uniref:Protein-glutamine gamma-glutamyltransferase-like C-terminal domain-containing protein n=1 Tax=Mycolicibacterium wolinskyi TaxID=59750 RepID=A0A1X2EV64_9MYCO|nr:MULTISPECIES: DUF4129 domain-containing protein [Mycolicibacterium]MCV7289696.1 DUF4129 domain-containing protein [Mycolicibacterium wolinskyi]MCV7296667.1 DUF4129 domain-containing protein [Mycolicibacterium goodii]ORX10180.1 hypothetical protein AWC31_08400 [Mycolicibacterium wolinskyi]
MPGIDKAAGRVATVLALVVVAAIALRGYVPGGQRAPAEARTDSPAGLVALIALLAVALAGFAFAVIAAPRKLDRPVGDEGFGRLELRGLQVRLRWRWALVALAALLWWLLVLILITRLAEPDEPAPSSSPPASAPPGSPPQQPPDPVGGGDSALRYLAVTSVILLLIVAFGTVVQARRRARPATWFDDGEHIASPPSPGGPETLARAAELGLAEIADLSRDPRTAIIACYAAMEHGLAQAPGAVPQDSDTPSEVLARAVSHHALSADSATELVELFTEARFSPHVMTEAHRDAAVAALHRVLADLRSLA